MPDANIEILRKETYLKAIENSVGSKLFNSLFVQFKDSGKVADVLHDGEYSCAFFVSGILTLMQMMDKPHTTVKKLKELLEANKNWQKIDFETREPGTVIFYEKTKFEDGSENAHVGFVLNKTEVVSTDYKEKMTVRHQIDARPVESIYRYSW